MTVMEKLDSCENFNEVFELVKKSAEQAIGRSRSGLMLYMARMPNHIAAFHSIGTNGIVMNRTLLDMVTRGARSLREVNAYVYSPLLHEYLHSLGCTDEKAVRKLVYDISLKTFGPDHPATKIAGKGPLAFFPRIRFEGQEITEPGSELSDIEMIPDIEGSSRHYIA